MRMWLVILGVIAVLALAGQLFRTTSPPSIGTPATAAMPHDLPFNNPQPNGRAPLPRSLSFPSSR